MNRSVLCIALALFACQTAQRPELDVDPATPSDAPTPTRNDDSDRDDPLDSTDDDPPVDEPEAWEIPHLNHGGCTSTSVNTVSTYDEAGWLVEVQRLGDTTTRTITHTADGQTIAREDSGLVEVYDAMRHLVAIEDSTGATLLACATQYEDGTPAGTATCISEWWPTEQVAYDDCGNSIEELDDTWLWTYAWTYQSDTCIPVTRETFRDGALWMTSVYDSDGKLLAKEWYFGEVETTTWSCD